jgi:predicted house-cleaning noncanonical NTP pyrophosphatase (MazG superfamily)
MKSYNKLVRDRIPEIIQAEGRQCQIEVLSDADFEQALRGKLVEEAQEAAQASEHLVQELADIYEVIDALIALHGLTEAQVRAVQAQRSAERGGFTRRLRLIWAE